VTESIFDPVGYQAELLLARRARKQKPRYVTEGSTHRAAIRALQERLSQLGYEISVDGVFGPKTLEAVKEFQEDRGAEADGIVGPKTLKKLVGAKRKEGNDADPGLDAIERVVSAGDKLPGTAAHGRALGNAVAQTKDGDGKPSKSDRVKAGAGETRLDPTTGAPVATSSTGPIGSTTVKQPTRMVGGNVPDRQLKAPHADEPPNDPEFEKLHPRGEGGEFAKKGDSGEEVKNTQTALNKVAKAGLAEDGQFGDKTDMAVRQYQEGAGLKVDGIVGPKTAGSLRRRLRLARKHGGA
jgi:peptidoglycan DL-endopeptidase CwlO